MRVLLRSDVAGVGRRGDLLEVADGYARNYLLPGGLAVVAAGGIEAQAARMRRSRDLRDAQNREAAQAQASVLAGAVIGLTARAGGNGRLFGSINAHDIVEAITAQKGVGIDRHALQLAEPIKETGSHTVVVHLHPEVDAEFALEVVGQS